jgi:aquaporin Z
VTAADLLDPHFYADIDGMHDAFRPLVAPARRRSDRLPAWAGGENRAMDAAGVVLRDPQTDGRAPVPRDGSPKPEASLPRRLFAEVLGTFFLTFVAAGGEVVASVTNGAVSDAAKVVAPALVVMAFVYAVGDVSGAHFNPAVTLAFAIRGVFRRTNVPAYWLAQVGAAIGAAAILRALFGDVEHLGATQVRHVSSGGGLVIEMLLTLILVTVILNTATRARVLGPNAAIAVGATIALCGLVAGPITGASMNPARSMGPALVAGFGTDWWVYVVGPVIGAVLAVAATEILHPRRDGKEVDAAEGEHVPKTKLEVPSGAAIG